MERRKGAFTDDAGRGARAPAAPLSSTVLEGIRARDPGALGVLFDLHFRRIFTLTMRLLRNRESAEDAVQEVFLRVHRSADTLDPTRDPGPWLTAIAVNVCRARWRSAEHRTEMSSRSLDGDPALREGLRADEPGPEDEAVGRERRELVAAALARLPQPQREVVILHDFEGIAHDEIAAMTGERHAAVRKRYSRAIASLREMLKDKL